MRVVADLVVVDCAAPLEQDEELVFDTAAPRRNAATLVALECADEVVVVGGCAVLIGAGATLAGLAGSWRLDTPTGPSIVVAAVIVLLGANLRPGAR